jgi:hypothetical protein
MIDWTEGTAVMGVPDSGMRHQLIYSGIDGSTVLVAYREFSLRTEGAFARPAFNQDLRYDLKKSRYVAFQDVRLTILDADNTHVNFRVDQVPALPH